LYHWPTLKNNAMRSLLNQKSALVLRTDMADAVLCPASAQKKMPRYRGALLEFAGCRLQLSNRFGEELSKIVKFLQ